MQDGKVCLVDQNKLPFEFDTVICSTSEEVAKAIQNMTVRGAPAIGAAGAYGLAMSAQSAPEDDFGSHLRRVVDLLLAARPTAVDLRNAVLQVYEHTLSFLPDITQARVEAISAAETFASSSAEECRLIGEHGQSLIEDWMGILTHCNAGALATVDWGTALSVLRIAWSTGRKFFVYVDETRPRLQGSRLTAFELQQEGIPHAIITDSMAGWMMRQNKINLVITGADRICLNGDFANKIGTYSLAVLAHAHAIPFYVAAPISTFDFSCSKGEDIPIEDRNPEEVTRLWGKQLANPGSAALNPAFDVTPGELISGFITSKGIFKPQEAAHRIRD